MPNTSIMLGLARLTSLDAGVFWYDGGAMFGGVPKVMWETLIRPDAKNRIPLTISPLLIETGARKMVVDVGFGGSHLESDAKRYDFDPSVSVVTALEKEGVRAADVDTVILTHLHSDHAGGVTTKTGRGVFPTFPNARYVVSRDDWDAALSPDPRSAAAYHADDLRVIERAGLARLVSGREDLGDGVSVEPTGGHTAGHLVAFVESAGRTAVYPADIVPSRYHVRVPYVAGIDLFPLDVIRAKEDLLARAADGEWIVILDHDATGNIGRVARDERGRFVFRDMPAERIA
jgi:glyoxylase-like metal-dependent hydrolase (beta-lactamase superfamily II)